MDQIVTIGKFDKTDQGLANLLDKTKFREIPLADMTQELLQSEGVWGAQFPGESFVRFFRDIRVFPH